MRRKYRVHSIYYTDPVYFDEEKLDALTAEHYIFYPGHPGRIYTLHDMLTHCIKNSIPYLKIVVYESGSRFEFLKIFPK